MTSTVSLENSSLDKKKSDHHLSTLANEQAQYIYTTVKSLRLDSSW